MNKSVSTSIGQKITEWFKAHLSILIFCVVFFGLFLAVHPVDNDENVFFSYLLLYMAVSAFSSLFPDWIIIKQIKLIINLPASILMLSGPLFQVWFFFVYAFVAPFLLIGGFIDFFSDNLLQMEISYPTKIYFLLVLGTIFTTLFCEKIIRMINLIMNYDHSETRKKSMIELSFSLANKNRIRFYIYLLYFFYLMIFSVGQLNNSEILFTSQVNLAVFYSFATYIAFERITQNYQLLDFKPKMFFKKLYNTWDSHGFFQFVKKDE